MKIIAYAVTDFLTEFLSGESSSLLVFRTPTEHSVQIEIDTDEYNIKQSSFTTNGINISKKSISQQSSEADVIGIVIMNNIDKQMDAI